MFEKTHQNILKMDMYVLLLKTIKVDIPENEYFHHIESQNIFLECMNDQPIFGRLRRFTKKNIRKDVDIATPNQEDRRRILVVSNHLFIFISVPMLLGKLSN